MAALSIQERKRLRQIGHALNPVVMIGGQGLTENVVEETTRALNDHELIKVKIAGEDREPITSIGRRKPGIPSIIKKVKAII